jgi:hypothetical protein
LAFLSAIGATFRKIGASTDCNRPINNQEFTLSERPNQRWPGIVRGTRWSADQPRALDRLTPVGTAAEKSAAAAERELELPDQKGWAVLP